jgi:TolB-like protein
MTLKLIGPFGLFGGNGGRIEITSRKSRALIALLALSPGGSRGRNWIQAMLWGSRFREQAQASLRRELATLCSVLEERGAGSLLERTTSWIRLDLEAVDVDVLSLGLVPREQSASSDGAFLEDVALSDCPEFQDWLQAQRSRVADLQRVSVQSEIMAPQIKEDAGASLGSAGRMLDGHPPALPPKPSVCVLPFRLIGSGDPFAGQGMAEELGMTLARFPSLFVVGTPTPDFERENAGSSVEIARRLGVGYLVRGTVMMDANRIRVAVQVVDGSMGHQLWTQSHDGLTDDLFALQQRIAEAVAPQIHTQIDVTELRGGLVDAIGSGDAYSLYWRANALFRQWTRESILEATEVCERLVAMQPSGSWGVAMAGFCHAIAYASGWTDDRAETRRTAVRFYQQAMRHGGEDPIVLGYAAGTLISIGGDLEIAESLIAHAISILPSYQPTLFWGDGWTLRGVIPKGPADVSSSR